MHEILKKLDNGDLKSIGHSEVAEEILAEPRLSL